jgi:hypothetical protein
LTTTATFPPVAFGDPGQALVFADFAAFVARLTEKLKGGATAQGLFAAGAYDAGANTLTANDVAVSLNLP